MSGRAMDFATLIYRQLPAVYRERDNTVEQADGTVTPGDLARLATTWGDSLDAIYRTLLQRYYDIFPEPDGAPDAEGMARGCQPWVLPYIARLLDVQLISPLEAGRRAEVGQAIRWRQRKGTPLAVEEIAEQVAGIEIELCEGWRRVAVTPRVGFALLPESVFGDPDGAFPADDRLARVEHPGLPAGSVDLRRASRAVRGDATSPATHTTDFAGQPVPWRMAWRHGVPCFASSFQDRAARTADLRTPDARRGHAHPRRVVLHAAPFDGFFARTPDSVQWSAIRDAVMAGSTLPAGLPLALTSDAGSRRLEGLGPNPVRIRGVLDLDAPIRWTFANLWFDNRVAVTDGRIEAAGCAFRELHVHTIDAATPVVAATACLFKRLLTPRSLSFVEYATVLERLVCERLQMSDSILLPMPHKDLIDADVPAGGCVRFSHLPYIPIPPDPLDPAAPNDPLWISQGRRSMLRVVAASCTTTSPIFWNTDFGQPGCAVLHPDSTDALRFGAEDGGEMGACHAFAHTLRERAVIDKLRDFLPVGIEAVLAPDASLLCPPPEEQP
ncbi:MAG: hypothetical protein KDH20_15980 [Rhodocyclaceae bacterium]|nr:hypothetical protein [Rhodocyclaceae bacterium]